MATSAKLFKSFLCNEVKLLDFRKAFFSSETFKKFHDSTRIFFSYLTVYLRFPLDGLVELATMKTHEMMTDTLKNKKIQSHAVEE